MASKTEAHAVAHDDGKVHVHIAPAKFYWGIFFALIALTIITVRVSYIEFGGSANAVVAMAVATMKASLVAAFFMHLRHDRVFNTVAFVSAFGFLMLFLAMTYDDLGKRAKVDLENGTHVLPATGEAAPGGLPMPTATSSAAAASHGAPGAAPAPAAAPHH